MSRELNHLSPVLRPVCKEHMGRFGLEVPDVLCVLSFTWRSIGEQDALYALGRDSAGNVTDRKKVVTNARGGRSWHNISLSDGTPDSLAYDLLLLDMSRKVLASSHVAWKKLGMIGLMLGLDWGVIGRSGSRWDLGHFYLRGKNRVTLDEAISGIRPVL